jgi:superfamily II DNA helicase RecQ
MPFISLFTELKNGLVKLIFTTPESVVLPYWVQLWKYLKHQLVCFAVDEVHCLVLW